MCGQSVVASEVVIDRKDDRNFRKWIEIVTLGVPNYLSGTIRIPKSHVEALRTSASSDVSIKLPAREIRTTIRIEYLTVIDIGSRTCSRGAIGKSERSTSQLSTPIDYVRLFVHGDPSTKRGQQ